MADTFRIKDAACTERAFFATGVASGAGIDTGLCRYNPLVSQPGAEAHGPWPVVAAQDWCGHHRPDAGA